MTMEPGKRVMIGEVLATSEELLPGPGTYDDGENIRAARFGLYKVDSEKFAAVIEPATKTPVVLKPGDVIIGEVYTVQESIVGITARFRVGDERRGLASSDNGTLHVSKIADRYIAVLSEVFKKGDIVRAKVLQGEPSLQLTTVGEEFGVIYSLCELCRNPLRRKGDVLECENCHHREVRYIAGDFGSGELLPEKEDLHGDEMQRGDRIRQPTGSGPPPVRPGLQVIAPMDQEGAPSRRSKGPGGGRGGGGRGGGGGRRDGGRGGGRRDGGRGGGGGRRDGGRGGGRREGGGRGPGRGGGGRGGDRGGGGRGGRSGGGGRGGGRGGGGDRGGGRGRRDS